MCLNKVSLNLEQKNGNQFVGIGYKLVEPQKAIKRWRKAGVMAGREHLLNNNGTLTCDYTLDKYFVGFHIFVRQEDARRYMPKQEIKRGNLKLYMVEFKNVTAFGDNSLWKEADGGVMKSNRSADCVIAQNIRYVEELPL